MPTIKVDPAQVRAAEQKVRTQADEYTRLYTQLYSGVSELQGSWTGEDHDAFVTQIEGFKDDFDKMKTLMTQYADFLRNAAQTYADAQDQIASQVKNLAN